MPARTRDVLMRGRARAKGPASPLGGRAGPWPSFTGVLVAGLPGAGEGVASSQAGGGHDVVGAGGVQAGDVVVGAGEAGDRAGPAAGLLRRTGELDRAELRLRHDARAGERRTLSDPLRARVQAGGGRAAGRGAETVSRVGGVGQLERVAGAAAGH